MVSDMSDLDLTEFSEDCLQKYWFDVNEQRLHFTALEKKLRTELSNRQLNGNAGVAEIAIGTKGYTLVITSLMGIATDQSTVEAVLEDLDDDVAADLFTTKHEISMAKYNASNDVIKKIIGPCVTIKPTLATIKVKGPA